MSASPSCSLRKCAVLVLALCSLGKAAESMDNPLVPDTIADPSVSYFDGTYYLYATTDIDQGLDKAGPPVVWTSRDFVNWSFSGTLFEGIDWAKSVSVEKSGKTRKGYYRYWAPGLVLRRDGAYWLFATLVDPADVSATYLFKAAKPEGPFALVGSSFPPAKENAVAPDIDGDPFIDDDGSAYLVWRRRMAGKLTPDWRYIEGMPAAIETKQAGYSEGPFLFKRKGVYYYCYTIRGNADYAYGYMVSHKSPLGPWEAPSQDLFLQSDFIGEKIWGPGHGNVFQVPCKDEWVVVYLEYGMGGTTRQVYADRLEFAEDGTIKPVKVTRRGVGRLGPLPAEQDLALGSKVTASSVREPLTIIPRGANKTTIVGLPAGVKLERTANYEPSNAVDDSNATRWEAKPDDAKPWFSTDLGSVRTLTRVEIAFARPTAGHVFTLEKSLDGVNWTGCGGAATLTIRSPQIVSGVGEARFLRVTIQQGAAGIWAFRALE